jgi:hypothetical protein
MLRKAIATPVGGKPRPASASCGMRHAGLDRAGRGPPAAVRCRWGVALLARRARQRLEQEGGERAVTRATTITG